MNVGLKPKLDRFKFCLKLGLELLNVRPDSLNVGPKVRPDLLNIGPDFLNVRLDCQNIDLGSQVAVEQLDLLLRQGFRKLPRLRDM